jgi:hypothetical protein
MQAAFFFNAKGTIDSMLQQTRSKGDLTHQIKWFFTEPISQIFFSSMADELSEGQGVTMHSDFSPQLSMTAGYGKEWDSTSHEWHYYGKDTLINHNNDVKIYHYYEWDTDSNSWQISELDTITISDDKITRVIEHYRFDSTWYRHRYSYLYDEHGNVFEFSQEKLEIPSRSWVLYLKVMNTMPIITRPHPELRSGFPLPEPGHLSTAADSHSTPIPTIVLEASSRVRTQ